MSAEPIRSVASTPSPSRPAPIVRTDLVPTASMPQPAWGPAPSVWDRPGRLVALLVLAVGFVLLGGGSLDLGPIEARLGLAASEPFGPLGQVMGGWEPSLWPVPLALSRLWAWGEQTFPTANAVRWPAALAAVAIGLILSRRVAGLVSGRAAVLVALAWYGSLAAMDRSAGAGLDLITGLATVAAFDRLLGRGSDTVAGAWLALAFLCGGWPPVALVALATVVLGRQGGSLSWRLLLPPFLAAFGWTLWALKAVRPEAWASALTLPIVQRAAWWFVPGVLALGLPWTPLALLVAAPSVRSGWSDRVRSLTAGFGQVVLVSLIVGTVVPGLATAARVPALAGIALLAGLAADRAIDGFATWGTTPRRWFLASAGLLVVGWTLLAGMAGGYLAAAVPYYRFLAVSLIVVAIPLFGLAILACARRSPIGVLASLFVLAICLKCGHWGYYVSEWNYRKSEGPWGRAIGQWVPPGWPIYTTHTWPADLAFATGHPVRQLPSERHLTYVPGKVRFVLLLASEFENWPEQAPALEKVAEMHDQHGSRRVLARTPGDFPWSEAARARIRALRGSAGDE